VLEQVELEHGGGGGEQRRDEQEPISLHGPRERARVGRMERERHGKKGSGDSASWDGRSREILLRQSGGREGRGWPRSPLSLLHAFLLFRVSKHLGPVWNGGIQNKGMIGNTGNNCRQSEKTEE
jgi:hypothetical protein